MPGLDGLRGLAVAAVVAFHLRPDALPGGFLGVDLFFVLSGFLITSLLVLELDARRDGRAAAASTSGGSGRGGPGVSCPPCSSRWSGSPWRLGAGCRAGSSTTSDPTGSRRWPTSPTGTTPGGTSPTSTRRRRRARSPTSGRSRSRADLPAVATGPARPPPPHPRPTAPADLRGRAARGRVGHGDGAHVRPRGRLPLDPHTAQALLLGALLAIVTQRTGRRRERRPGSRLERGRHDRTGGSRGHGGPRPRRGRVDVPGRLHRRRGPRCARGGRGRPRCRAARLRHWPGRAAGAGPHVLRHLPLPLAGDRVPEQGRTGLEGWPLDAVRLAVVAVLTTVSFKLVEQPVRDGRWRGWAERTAAPLAAGSAAALLVATGLAATSVPSYLAGPSAAPTFPVAPSIDRRSVSGSSPTTAPPTTESTEATATSETVPRPAPHRIVIIGDSVANSLAPGVVAAAPPRHPGGGPHRLGVRPRDQQRAGVRRWFTHRVHGRLQGRHPTGADQRSRRATRSRPRAVDLGGRRPRGRRSAHAARLAGVERVAGRGVAGDAPAGEGRRGDRHFLVEAPRVPGEVRTTTSTGQSPRCGRP